MDKTLKKWLFHHIEWERLLSHDGIGDPVYDDSVLLQGYWSGRNQMVFNIDGHDVVCRNVIYFDGNDVTVDTGGVITCSMGAGDRYTLPDGRVVTSANMIPYYTQNRLDYVEVFF